MEQVVIKKRVIGVDISLEETTFAIVNAKGEILVKDSFPTENYPNANDYISTLSERILMMIESNGGYESIRSVGVSCPSANFATGCMENSPNMPWKGIIPIGPMMRDHLGIAVAVANNAQVIALGEHAFGCARGMRNFVVITLGTGMGSCIFSNGLIHKGSDGYAGEVGHACIVKNGRLCGCGHHGCLETYTAAKGIVVTAQEVLAESNAPSLMRSVEKLSPKIIAEFCDQGDELAIEVFRRTGFMLGLGLANYASIVNPEAFIFTGGIAKAGDWLLDPMQETFEKYVYNNMQGKMKFLVSELDEDNHDVLGASVLAWEVKEYSLFK
jgi:glucokinase